MESNRLSRVAIVGTSCTGKTTLARSLSRTLGRPHIELDALYWGPNWTPIPPEDFRSRVHSGVPLQRQSRVIQDRGPGMAVVGGAQLLGVSPGVPSHASARGVRSLAGARVHLA